MKCVFVSAAAAYTYCELTSPLAVLILDLCLNVSSPSFFVAQAVEITKWTEGMTHAWGERKRCGGSFFTSTRTNDTSGAVANEKRAGALIVQMTKSQPAKEI